MKKILSILAVLAILAAMGLSFLPTHAVKADGNTALDSYAGESIAAASGGGFTVSYPGIGGSVAIGSSSGTGSGSQSSGNSHRGGQLAFTPSLDFDEWNGQADFSLTPETNFSADGALTASGNDDGSITASNSDWNLTFAATTPSTGLNQYGGLDFDIQALTPLTSNQIVFDFDSSTGNVQGYVQPPMTSQYTVGESLPGGDTVASVSSTQVFDNSGNLVASMPAYAVNSIAVYSTLSGDYSQLGGINYGNGEIGMLYAPTATDPSGDSAQCAWSINSDGNYVLTIPQTFLGNATYPLTIQPPGDSFGFTGIGVSSSAFGAAAIFADRVTPSNPGNVSSISFYAEKNGTGNSVEAALYNDMASLISPQSASGTVSSGSGAWTTLNFTGGPEVLSSQEYDIAFYSATSGGWSVFFYYNTASANSSIYQGGGITFPNWPASSSGFSTGSNTDLYSIYATFTDITSAAVSFTTPTNLTTTSATLNGSVTGLGGDSSASVVIYWGLTDGGTTAANWTHSSSPTSPVQPQGAAPFSLNLMGLKSNSTIYYSATITNSAGTVWLSGGSLNLTTVSVVQSFTLMVILLQVIPAILFLSGLFGCFFFAWRLASNKGRDWVNLVLIVSCVLALIAFLAIFPAILSAFYAILSS